MVTVLRRVVYDKHLLDIRCKSTDEKPKTGVPNGSSCLEMDTGKKYMFDGDTNDWIEANILINADGIYY